MRNSNHPPAAANVSCRHGMPGNSSHLVTVKKANPADQAGVRGKAGKTKRTWLPIMSLSHRTNNPANTQFRTSSYMK